MWYGGLVAYSSVSTLFVVLLVLSQKHPSIAFFSDSKHQWGSVANHRKRPSQLRPLFQSLTSNNNDKDVPSPTFKTNELTHAMIRVPDVNETVSYWVDERGATIKSFRESKQSATAFVGFDGFSLEITSLQGKETFGTGNAVRYFGLSMLLDFDLRSAASGGSAPRPLVDTDPNGWTLKSVAAAPGDSFSRICLRIKEGEGMFSSTSSFYRSIGMEEVAADETTICLRYKNSEKEGKGNSVNLVFERDENSEETLDMGNGFDHLAISTDHVDSVFNFFSSSEMKEKIFMKPTDMFGSRILGVTDPNGYKVYLYETNN